MLHTAIFIGRSGCGKGTQAELLRDRINKLDKGASPILYIETGPRFRQFVRGEGYSSKLSHMINESGERQPDFLACWMWSTALVEELHDKMHLVFDGAPRSAGEARMLTTALEFYKREKPVVIYIDVSREWSEERLLARGRSDDRSLQKINKRLDWFEEDVLPAIEYFRTNPYYRLIEVDGEQPIEKVHLDIVKAYEYQA